MREKTRPQLEKADSLLPAYQACAAIHAAGKEVQKLNRIAIHDLIN